MDLMKRLDTEISNGSDPSTVQLLKDLRHEIAALETRNDWMRMELDVVRSHLRKLIEIESHA